jgi:hypothetical protein
MEIRSSGTNNAQVHDGEIFSGREFFLRERAIDAPLFSSAKLWRKALSVRPL